jgi:uncharacterized protein (DUF1015 family)
VTLIKPFRAVRPAPEKAKLVSSVPYDVIYESEAREFIKENPYSFLRITRPEAEESDCESVEHARDNFELFLSENILAKDTQESYFVYRLSTAEHSQTGVVACCSLDEYEAGLIKPHEKTRPDKVEDRTRHMVGLRAQTGLIFLAHRPNDVLKKICAEAATAVPLYDFECATGVRHTVWRCDKTDEMTDAFAAVPALYVADGHHRLESAEQARKRLQSENPVHDGTEEYNYVMAGMFPADELQILAYNRTVSDINGLTREELLDGIRQNFIITEVDNCTPLTHGEICMYFEGQWFDLRFAVEYFREPDPIERLDVTILQKYLLEPVLGIDDPRTDERIGFVGGGRGTGELMKLVDNGEARIAFSLYPTTMDDLFAVSDMGEIMPPKSTWFEPKLIDGLFVHLI